MRMSSLKGKKALVLGGSRGIGAAIVERLAAEGAETVFTYAGSKDAAAALAGRTGTRAVQADRKSTRLNSSTNAHLVCRLLLEKKNRTAKPDKVNLCEYDIAIVRAPT